MFCAIFEQLRVVLFLYTYLGMNDGASALPFHSADDITALDDATAPTAHQIPMEIAPNRLKKHNLLPSCTLIGFVPFLENPDDRDITLFTTLMVAKPFATAKARPFGSLAGGC
jgi:hypothetical protein